MSLPQNRIPVGEIYFQWDRKDRHHLVLDLTGLLPEWGVEADGEMIPLCEYLGRHPGRREGVRQLIRRRLEITGKGWDLTDRGRDGVTG